MKTSILAVLLILISVNCFSQQTVWKIPLIVTIDGQIITEGMFHGFFFIVDSSGKNVDTIKFDCQVGQANMTKKEYNELHSIKPGTNVEVQFAYTPFKSITQTQHVYKHILSQSAINDVYIILNVYNYANKINYKFFSKRKGYGVEELFPGGGTVLLARIKKPPIPW
jgi:hypothetical protein